MVSDPPIGLFSFLDRGKSFQHFLCFSGSGDLRHLTASLSLLFQWCGADPVNRFTKNRVAPSCRSSRYGEVWRYLRPGCQTSLPYPQDQIKQAAFRHGAMAKKTPPTRCGGAISCTFGSQSSAAKFFVRTWIQMMIFRKCNLAC